MSLISMAEGMFRRSLNKRGHHSRWHESSLGALHFFDFRGDGALPPLVLLHGIGSSALPYRLLFAALRPQMRRILCPDAPGHGLSADPAEPLDADLLFRGICELLDAELDEPAIIFGNSLGGALALRYGLTRPERVRGLVLSSPAGAAMSAAEIASLVETFRFDSRKAGRRFFNNLHHRPQRISWLVAGEVLRIFNRPSIVQLLDALGPDDLFSPEQLAQLSVPTLLLWGDSEKILPASSLAWYQQHCPPSMTIEQPEGFGHCPYLDCPQAVVDRILQFAEALERNPK